MQWLALTWRSALVAGVAAAAQLGVATTVGLTRWDTHDAAAWSTLLTWVALTFVLAAALGTAAGRAPVGTGGTGLRRGAVWVAPLAAALGAGVALPLAILSARGAQPPQPVNAELVVTLTVGAGIVAGLLIGLAALRLPALATGLRVTAAWVWLAAIASVVVGGSVPRVAVVEPLLSTLPPWTDPRLMIGVAALVGLGVAIHARWAAKASRAAVALAGAAGPLAVAAAYLIAGPGFGDAASAQSQPYLAALAAVGSGAVASSIIAAPRRAGARASMAAAVAVVAPAAPEVAPPPPAPPHGGPTPAPPHGGPTPVPPPTLPPPMGQPPTGQPPMGQPPMPPAPWAPPAPAERPRPAWAGEYRVPYVPPPRPADDTQRLPQPPPPPPAPPSQQSWQDWETEERPTLGGGWLAHHPGRHARPE